MSRFVLGINSQLVEIDSNHRLSRIVRNSTSPSIVVIGLEFFGYIEHGNATPAMVIIVMLHNDISYVSHRLVVNLVVNSYN